MNVRNLRYNAFGAIECEYEVITRREIADASEDAEAVIEESSHWESIIFGEASVEEPGCTLMAEVARGDHGVISPYIEPVQEIAVRNPRVNALGTFDCEIEHEALGWIPFTAAPHDSEPHGRQIYARIHAGSCGEIRPYSAPALASERLCSEIDNAADSARQKLMVDPTRAIEYQIAAAEAQAFADAGYPADGVPRSVAADMLEGRTAEESANRILTEANAYNTALYALREIRLKAKSEVREAEDLAEAEAIAQSAIEAISAAVSGVGNNTSSEAESL